MLGGKHTPEEILASVKNGIYAVHFGGGQVDITSGKFVFSCTEAYRVEDGILKGYIQDRLNARLMGVPATGNGRRESYAHAPMPRMTNTFMRGGNDDPAELLGRVKNGIYAKSFGGGQVDIVSGKFVFSCTEAYKIENGKLGAPIKGATLIGDGPSVLTRVTGIGNDMALDEGVGVCGKGGQSVPAGVGQPTLLVEGLTVGGTA
jgi:TldD protein